MKVGIMSMQRVPNYGSFLQAYGLKRLVERLGHEVEFVDYKIDTSNIEAAPQAHPAITPRTLLRFIKHRTSAKKRKMYRAAADFNAFYNRFLALLGVQETENEGLDVDTLVVGSDEVFNCFQTNKTRVDSFDLFGAKHCDKPCLSYAASFGSTTLEAIEHSPDREALIAALRNNFSHLSVRDDNSYDIIRTLLPEKEISMNLDPVLMYDFTEEIVSQTTEQPYIVVYAYRGRISDAEGKAIKRFAKKKNMKLVCFGGVQDFCDEYILASPFELLGYMKGAAYVITDTFHGTIFSLKYGRPFATITRDNNKNKTVDLLNKFGLNNREVRAITELERVLEQPYDTEAVQNIIAAEQEKATAYLSNAIR